LPSQKLLENGGDKLIFGDGGSKGNKRRRRAFQLWPIYSRKRGDALAITDESFDLRKNRL
jgi:hypothetical protein